MPPVGAKPSRTAGNGTPSGRDPRRDSRGRFGAGNSAAAGHGPRRGLTLAVRDLEQLLERRDQADGRTLRERLLERVLSDALRGRAAAQREVLARILPVRLLVELEGDPLGLASVPIEQIQAAEQRVADLIARVGPARARELLQ